LIVLKKSVARKLPVLLVDSGGAVVTGIAVGSVTVVTSKDGGALTVFTLTGKWTELGQGLYTISFADTDLDTEGFFAYLVTVTGCDQYSGIMYVSDWETTVDSIASALTTHDTAIKAAITTAEGNIRGTDSDDLKALSVQIDGVQTDTTAIKGKTNNLPTDPADESSIQAGIVDARDAIVSNETTMETNLAADITDAESNIRGGAYDLHLLYDELGTVQTALTAIKGVGWTDENLTTIDGLIDAIKAKTENLPADPADESSLEAAITTAANNVRGTDSDTLKTLSEQIDLTALEATLTAMKGVGWTTETLKAIKAAVDTNGDDIDDVLGNQVVIDGKLDTIDTNLDTTQIDLAYVKQKESGRWKIANNQLTYYDDDGATVLRRFNLFNRDGVASNENPYERVPV